MDAIGSKYRGMDRVWPEVQVDEAGLLADRHHRKDLLTILWSLPGMGEGYLVAGPELHRLMISCAMLT